MRRAIFQRGCYAWGRFIAVLLVAMLIAGCGPKLGKAFVKLDNIPPGKAVVYLYRPLGGIGYILPIDIYSNEALIVSMPHQSYYPYLVEPGEVEFNSRHGVTKQVHESITIQAKAGQAYFVKTIFRPVRNTAQASLEAMPPEEGADEIRECKLILDEGREAAKKP